MEALNLLLPRRIVIIQVRAVLTSIAIKDLEDLILLIISTGIINRFLMQTGVLVPLRDLLVPLRDLLVLHKDPLVPLEALLVPLEALVVVVAVSMEVEGRKQPYNSFLFITL